jgi:hypothetical protein
MGNGFFASSDRYTSGVETQNLLVHMKSCMVAGGIRIPSKQYISAEWERGICKK